MSVSRGLLGMAQRMRGVATSSVARQQQAVHPGYQSIKPIQGRFGSEDGTPIFRKAGVVDNLLYKVTMGCCVAAVLWDIKLYYELGLKG